MNEILESVLQQVEQARLGIGEAKAISGEDSKLLDKIDDIDLALGWAAKKDQ